MSEGTPCIYFDLWEFIGPTNTNHCNLNLQAMNTPGGVLVRSISRSQNGHWLENGKPKYECIFSPPIFLAGTKIGRVEGANILVPMEWRNPDPYYEVPPVWEKAIELEKKRMAEEAREGEHGEADPG